MNKVWSIIFAIGMICFMSFLIYGVFNTLSYMDDMQDYCENKGIGLQNSTYNTNNYYTLDRFCCYTDDNRIEHCERVQVMGALGTEKEE